MARTSFMHDPGLKSAEPHVSAEAGTSRRAPMTHVEAWERPTATTAYLTISPGMQMQGELRARPGPY